MPVPVPPDLAARLAEGHVVLFAGAGMSRPAGLPGWTELLNDMLAWAARQQISLSGAEDGIRDLIARAKLPLAGRRPPTPARHGLRRHLFGVQGRSPAEFFRPDRRGEACLLFPNAQRIIENPTR